MGTYILITGGTKGIGYAVANCMAKAGFNLLLTYVSDCDNAKRVEEELSSAWEISVSTLQVDCSKLQSIETIASYAEENNLLFKALVFNAGKTCRDSFEEIKQEDWESVFNANVHFPVFLLQRMVKQIQKGGSVVFTGSMMGIEPHSVSLAYGVSKTAVHGLVKNLVKFLSPMDIRVNGVAPGFVDTEWQKTKPAEIRQNIERKIALARFCDPDELAEVYKMLIQNSYFNGEILTVSGGYSYK